MININWLLIFLNLKVSKLKFCISLRDFNKFQQDKVVYNSQLTLKGQSFKIKLPSSSASDLTLFIQKCNLPCFLKHNSNAFKSGQNKKNAPFWRGVYSCSNLGCCIFHFIIKKLDETIDFVYFEALIYGKINHAEVIHNELLRRMSRDERTKVALQLMANEII